MHHLERWLAAGLLAAAVGLAGCAGDGPDDDAAGQAGPAKVVPIEGTDRSRVELTAEAATRLGIRTEPVRTVQAAAPGKGAGTPPRLAIPMAAVLYDDDGDTWTYTSTGPLSFVREAVTVAGTDGDLAVLSSGPPPGTPVVTVGAAELLGAEYKVDGD